jgi:hypothetical protein
MSVLTAIAQSDSIKGNQYLLKGKFINEISLSPYCGGIAFATVIEFKIISFSDSSWHGKQIAVIFTCPEFYGKDFFERGKKYEVVVSDQNQVNFSWTIINGQVLKKYNLKYKPWVIKAKKIE